MSQERRKLLPLGFRTHYPPGPRQGIEEDLEVLRAMGFADEDLCLLHMPGSPEAGHGIIDQAIPCPHEWEEDSRIAHQGELYCRFCGNNKPAR